MKYKLFEEIVLNKDIPGKKLKKGDFATIVAYHPLKSTEDRYSLETYNVPGDMLAVITVPESAIDPLSGDEVFGIKPSWPHSEKSCSHQLSPQDSIAAERQL